MYLINTGNIHVSKNITEVAKILVEEGIYSSLDMVPVYDEHTIGIEDVYGDIESELDRVVDRCNTLGIELTGNIDYVGDAEGRYLIGKKVESLSKRDLIIRDAPVSTLLKELERRGVYLMNETSEKPTLVAYDIKWDTDGDEEVLHDLPKGILIPDGMVDDEEISDYVSAETGFCHTGFKLGIRFRGQICPFNYEQINENVFRFEIHNFFLESNSLKYSLIGEYNRLAKGWNLILTSMTATFDLDVLGITKSEIEAIKEICTNRIMSETGSDSYEIDQMLTISSVHVSQSTRELLDEVIDDTCCVPMPPVYEKSGYGWFVACLPDYDNESLGVSLEDYPADLAAAMRLAKEHGCIWLCIDCVEINKDLRNCLKGAGYRVVGDDFLTYSTMKQYDLIVMNPPFSNGDAHLLKALKMQQR